MSRFSETLDEFLEEAVQPAELETHIDRFISANNLFIEALAARKRVHAALPTLPEVKPATSSSTSAITLDRLRLPRFDGQQCNWLAFKDVFTKLVHNAEFPEAYKMDKLRECEDPEEVPLMHMLFTGRYKALWASLMERYDSPHKLAVAHIHELLALQRVSSNAPGGLMHLVDTVLGSIFESSDFQ